MVERYRRTYGNLPRLIDTGEADYYRQVQQQLSGFTSQMGRAAVEGLQRQSLSQAEEQAMAYDPTQGAPVLSERQNRAARAYNQTVTKAYEDQVYNDSINSLSVLAEQYKGDPQGYEAAANQFRTTLANESGALVQPALNVFDSISARAGAKIRAGVASKSLEAGKAAEGISLTNEENEIFESITDTDFDEVRSQRLLDGYRLRVSSAVHLNDLEKIQRVTDINRRVFLATNRSMVTDLLDQGDVQGAQNYINKIRRTQKVDGSKSNIYKASGLRPNDLADDLDDVLQQYADDISLQVRVEDDVDKAADQAVVNAQLQASTALANLGNDIKVEDVKAQRQNLDDDEYESFMRIALGAPTRSNAVFASDLYVQMLDASRDDDFTEMSELRITATSAYANGLISHTEYQNITEIDENTRFEPGFSEFESITQGIKLSGPAGAFIMPQVNKAEQQFQQWARRNPDATAEQVNRKVQDILSKYPQINQVLSAVQGVVQ